jgi:hypothetical protein
MGEISKSDWKLFQERLPEWQEHYMERLTKEYIELLSSPGNASDHFRELEKRIKKDKKESWSFARGQQVRGTLGYSSICRS